MIKKLTILAFALIMAFAMTAVFTACGSGEPAEDETEAATEPATEATEALSGGWEIVSEPSYSALPDEVQTAFDTFMNDYNDELIPMAYYGKQETAAGTNYGLLCKSTNDSELQTVVLQEDPELGMSAVINQFIISDYTEGSGSALDGEPEEDEWEVPYDTVGSQIPEEATTAYDNAKAAYEGTSPDVLTLLGTQVVAGTNYAFLAKGQTDTDTPRTAVQVVTVYEDLEGNAKISNICTLDMESFDE